ncbi:MAG: xanthine dehydrogenase family protein molybdopterin-binding subunit [Rhodospirillales bacterium]|nr:MAG: xanthine dehydrogenase family protein molybdopterin-binding subunit [Rhodospirillales bacterium]
MSAIGGGIGAASRRIEDARFLKGEGCFTDDLVPENAARGYVLRSPYANALIRGIDTKAAQAAPGVIAVLTGEDVAADELGDIPCARQMKKRDGAPMYQPPRPVLNRHSVRYVGDHVAFVIAETVNQAKDAAELIEVDYEALPAVTSLRQVLAPGAPAIRADCPDNHCFHHEAGDRDAVDAAFAEAAHVVRLEVPISRVQPTPLEPRAVIGEYDPARDSYTLITGTQSPNRAINFLAEPVLKIERDRLRVVCHDMGGGFGNRSAPYHEQVLAMWAAKRIGRPVKWTCERSESFQADDQGRDNLTMAEMALDGDGNFLAIRVRTATNTGAYVYGNGPNPMVGNIGCLAGVYRTPAIHVEVDAYFTNTNGTSAYRGAGRPEAIYVLERLIDAAARQTGIDPVELRRRNLIRPDEFPYQTALTFNYDSGDFAGNMDKALALMDHAGFAARRAESASRGRLRGRGVINAIESAGKMERGEEAVLDLGADGRAILKAGTCAHGQGHETAFRQLLTEYLGLGFDDVDFQQGDSAVLPTAAGTFGSRSITIGGGAVRMAAFDVIEQAKSVAADALEAAAADIVFAEGVFTVAGTDRTIALREVCRHAAETGRTLESHAEYAPDATTYPNACHICEVEIDPETGRVEIQGYGAVGDFGVVVNPMIVEGQMHGGIAQGAGQILLEQIVWDADSGQLLTGSFMDYAMPRADDLSEIRIGMNPQPTTKNSLGVKGCGEAGCVGSLAAVMNAIIDALAQRGVTDLEMPATPHRVWRALHGAAA